MYDTSDNYYALEKKVNAFRLDKHEHQALDELLDFVSNQCKVVEVDMLYDAFEGKPAWCHKPTLHQLCAAIVNAFQADVEWLSPKEFEQHAAVPGEIVREVFPTSDNPDFDFVGGHYFVVISDIDFNRGAKAFDMISGAVDYACDHYMDVDTDYVYQLISEPSFAPKTKSLDTLITAAGEPTSGEPNKNDRDKDAR